MLKGNWIINVISASSAFIIVFSASYYQNLLSTTLIRASLAFVGIFLLAYLFRWFAFLAFSTEEKPVLQVDETQSIKEKQPTHEDLGINDEGIQLSEEDVLKTSQYVKDLLENEEG